MADSHLRNLCLKMEYLRQEQSCTDVTMKCKDGLVFAHKNILMASCGYFEKMFTIEMSEKISGEIQFPTISKHVIELIIQYLYTARIPELTEDSVLIQTCHMMELNDFLVGCWVQKTMHHLNLENFADLWAIGVDFDCYKKSPIEEYLKNNLNQIVKKNNLTNLTAIHLIKLIELIDRKAFCKKCIQIVLEWKSVGGREEKAAEIFRKIDLSHLDDIYLHALLQIEIGTKKYDTIENVLTQEAVGRLPKRYNACKDFSRVISSNCDLKCTFRERSNGMGYYSSGREKECNAEVGLKNIKDVLKNIKAALKPNGEC